MHEVETIRLGCGMAVDILVLASHAGYGDVRYMLEVGTIRFGCGMIMLWGEIMLILGEVMYTLEVETIMFHLGEVMYMLEICGKVLQSGKTKLSCGKVWYLQLGKTIRQLLQLGKTGLSCGVV